MTPPSGTVVVIAEHPMQAARMEAALRRLPGWRVCVEQPSRLREIVSEHPEAIVVLALSGAERRRVLRAIRGWARRPAVIALADDGADVWTPAARALGVRAVLPSSSTTPEELMEAVRAVHAGLFVLHPETLARARAGQAVAPGAPLTSREREILEMLADGASNRSIAARLGISRHTAKFHVASILTKLGVQSRTEAVAIALRSGLLTL